MLLSPGIIYAALKHSFTTSVTGPISSTLSLKKVVFISSGELPQENAVNIPTEPVSLSWDRLPTGSLLACIDSFISPPQEATADVILIHENTNAFELYNLISEVFHIFENWNQNTLNAVYERKNIADLVALAGFLIPNPIMLVNLDFRIVASANLPYQNLRDNMFGSTAETKRIVDFWKRDRDFITGLSQEDYFRLGGYDWLPSILCVNIIPFETAAYRLIVFGGPLPLDDVFGKWLEYCAKIYSHAVSLHGTSSTDSAMHFHQIFRSIVDESEKDYVQTSLALSELGWMPAHNYLCVLIRTGMLDYASVTLNSVCTFVENTIPASCAFPFRDSAVVFINMSLTTLSFDDISGRFTVFIRDSLLKAGYSRIIHGHLNFLRQYEQADIAIRIGSRIKPTAWIYRFNPVALPYIQERITEELPSYMISHEGILRLRNYDYDHGSALYPTLRTYLQNQQNATKTAELLFIHRSTLLYRLEKIDKILQADLDNPDEVLYLLLSIHLLDEEDRVSPYLNEKKTNAPD